MDGKPPHLSPTTYPWYRYDPDRNALCIFLYTQPNARTTEFAGLHDGRLKIRVAAPALDGRANATLLEFVRRRLDLPAHAIAMTRGQRSRMKTLEIRHPSAQTLKAIHEWNNQ